MEEREPPVEERRKYPRFPLSCPIAFSGDLIAGEGNVVNISKLGCAVQSDQQVEEGAYLNLFLRLPEGAVPVKIELAGTGRAVRNGIHPHPPHGARATTRIHPVPRNASERVTASREVSAHATPSGCAPTPPLTRPLDRWQKDSRPDSPSGHRVAFSSC